MKVTALTIHFVTCISRVLISQKYSPFLHIYNLVSCCPTCATVMYITMLWMNLLHVDAWYEWSCLGFVVFIYITIYWHRFDIIIYYGNKAVYISWIDAKKVAHNLCKPVQDCCVKNNINLWQNRLTILFVTYTSRVLISQKYSPFLHIYCIVSCCLTSATVIYITMLWMKIVTCWCMLWMKSL